MGGAHGAGVHTTQKNAHEIGSVMSAVVYTQQKCAGTKRNEQHSSVVVHRTKSEETAFRGAGKETEICR